MRWADMRMGNKIRCGFYLIIAIFLLASIFTYQGVNQIAYFAQTATEKEQISSALLQREVDHLKWAQSVSGFTYDPAQTKLSVQEDASKCAFGEWFYSDEKTRLSRLMPGLASSLHDIESPHKLLHETATKIQQLRNSSQQAEAISTYTQETLRQLQSVQTILQSMRKRVQAEMTEARKSFANEIDGTKMIIVVITAIAIVLGVALGFFISNSISRPVHLSAVFAKSVSEGNLEARLDVEQKDEVGILAATMQSMVATLKTKIAEADARSRELESHAAKAESALALTKRKESEVTGLLGAMNRVASDAASISERLAASADQISTHVLQASQGTEVQKDRLSITAVAMVQMNATVLDVARNAGEASASAGKAQQKAQEGATIVRQGVEAINKANSISATLKTNMAELSAKAESVGQVMNMISDIADQTNLLALNAAIEAARAGEAGRGFAVVADEVRKLAEKTMSATSEVGDIIKAIQNSTRTNMDSMEQATAAIRNATLLAEKSGESLKEIVSLASQSADHVHSIAAAAEQQSQASGKITESMDEVKRIAFDTAASMHGNTQLVHELSTLAHELRSVIEKLNV